MIEAIKGVQAPGAIAKSDNNIIEKPVMKPATGPNTKPLTKLRVSLNPTFIAIPYTGSGDTIATSSIPIRTTAPIAINAETKAICFGLNVRL
jgi:hypothetical protein